MIEIYRAQVATEQLAADIGAILPFLSEHHSGGPMNFDYLQNTIESPAAVQLVASIGDTQDAHLLELAERYRVVGAATLSTLHGDVAEKAWLEDFVVVPDVRGKGVAQGLWDAMVEWRIEKGLYQMRFNSNAGRKSAHGFYYKNGCEVLADGKTTLFVHNIER